jgi:hypothetical protein
MKTRGKYLLVSFYLAMGLPKIGSFDHFPHDGIDEVHACPRWCMVPKAHPKLIFAIPFKPWKTPAKSPRELVNILKSHVPQGGSQLPIGFCIELSRFVSRRP